MCVGTGDGCPIGDTPPITWPVCRRTNSGLARRSAVTPRVAATFPVSTRWAPEVRISTGAPSASKSRLFAIAPTSQPSASAASAAVCTESGRTSMRPRPPRPASAVRNLVMAACSGRGSWLMAPTLGSCSSAAPSPLVQHLRRLGDPLGAGLGALGVLDPERVGALVAVGQGVEEPAGLGVRVQGGSEVLGYGGAPRLGVVLDLHVE